MPRITLALTTNYENITRPVATSMARDVMRICDIPQSTPLYFPGEFEQANQPGTNQGDDGNEIRWQSDRRLIMTAEDLIKQDAVLQTVVRQNEQPPFLEDRRLGVSLRPVYVTSTLKITFKYVCSTRQEAIRWRDEMAVKRAENRTSLSHQIQYDIPVSDGTLGTLAHLHGLRESIAGYGENFAQWFKGMQRAEFLMIGTQDGRKETLNMMVRQKQVHLTGYFEFADIPQERKVSGNSTWEIEFSYNVDYDRCTHLYFVYPLVVHQQHIDEAFYDSTPRFGVEELNKSGAIGITALDHMNEYVNYYPGPAGGIRVPYYDEWNPPKAAQAPYTVPLASWMVVLDPEDPQYVLDLTDLPDMTWAEQIDTFFRNNPAKLTKRGACPYIFSIWAGDVPIDQSLVYIDEHLVVRTTKTLDLRKAYHVRLSFITNYSVLTSDAVYDMKTNPVATLLGFQSVWPALDVEWAMHHLIDGQYLTTNYMVWFYQLIMNHRIGMFNQGGSTVHGPGGTNQRWKGGIAGVGRNSGGAISKPSSPVGPKNPSLYTGSNWRVNMSDGGYSNPNHPWNTGDGHWDEDGNWIEDGKTYPPGYVDITDPTYSRRSKGGPHYVQFLTIFTKR